MSRQFDEYMSDKFELNGTMYQMVEPDSFDELMKAFEIRNVIQMGINQLMHDEDDSAWQDLLQEQEGYIQEYIDGIGDFNNGCLVKNIAYLLKKYGLRMGDLEKLLGISAGYISRTVKENSSKKLSIDVVWKIAKLFEISVQKLIEDDLSDLSGNKGILVDFMDKLKEQTQCVEIEWDNLGGVKSETDERFEQIGLFSATEDGKIRYAAPGRNPRMGFYLADDIISTYGVDEFKEMIIVPFYTEKSPEVHYDFMFVWSTGNERYSFEKIFYSYDEPFGTLDEHAKRLYEEAKEHFFDVPVASDMRKFITEYLGKDGDA